MKKIVSLILVVLMVFSLAACQSGGSESASTSTSTGTGSSAGEEIPVTADGEIDWEALGITPVDALSETNSNVQPVDSIAPDGNPFATQADIMSLFTAEDLQKIKDGNYTAVTCQNYTIEMWNVMQIAGITAACEALGIELLTVTDANWDIEKGIADVESAIAMEPDMIILKPVEGDPYANVIKEATEKGIKVVLIDMTSDSLVPGTDYVGLAQTDNATFAAACAESIAERMGGEGQVAILDYEVPIEFCVTRLNAALAKFEEYPGIEVVGTQKFRTNEDAASVTESMLSANPEIDAFWATWDVPAMAGSVAATAIGYDKVIFSGSGLGLDGAYAVATDGTFIGGSNDFPYDLGVTEVLMGAAAILGKEVPVNVACPITMYGKDTLEETWEMSFHEPLPDQVKNALN